MMNDSSTTAANLATYDRYYDKPHWWFTWRYDTQVKRKTILHLARRWRSDWSDATIGELGFGSGSVLLSFPRACRLRGAEIAQSAVDHAQREARRRGFLDAQFVVAEDPAALPFSDAGMDLLVASHVLEHVPDDAACLRELKRLIKPGGALIAAIPINERHEDPHHVRRYTTATFRSLLAESGFDVLNVLESEWLYYLVENLYWRHATQRWSPLASAARVAFNLLTSRWPFPAYQLADRIMAGLTGLPARQVTFLCQAR
jgi:ubiquinone/menaquinone biosynthesis C-methylase UbiE